MVVRYKVVKYHFFLNKKDYINNNIWLHITLAEFKVQNALIETKHQNISRLHSVGL